MTLPDPQCAYKALPDLIPPYPFSFHIFGSLCQHLKKGNFFSLQFNVDTEKGLYYTINTHLNGFSQTEPCNQHPRRPLCLLPLSSPCPCGSSQLSWRATPQTCLSFVRQVDGLLWQTPLRPCPPLSCTPVRGVPVAGCSCSASLSLCCSSSPLHENTVLSTHLFLNWDRRTKYRKTQRYQTAVCCLWSSLSLLRDIWDLGRETGRPGATSPNGLSRTCVAKTPPGAVSRVLAGRAARVLRELPHGSVSRARS